MLTLYGFPVSNYYNVVKAALLEKEIPFKEELIYFNQSKKHLDATPMGKVPWLGTEAGTLAETQVMLDYLEEVHPEPRLYPVDPFRRAKVRELMRVIELYIELPARRLYPEAFFGGKVSDQVKQEVRSDLAKGMAALQRVVRFEPYIAGSEFGYADIVAVMHLPLANRASKTIYGEDILSPIAGIADYLADIRGRSSLRTVMADHKADLAAYTAQVRA